MDIELLIRIAAILTVLGTGVVYGTDVFCAMVMRPALARVGDDALVAVMGRVHRFGDRRMPVPGVLGVAAALVGTVAAAVTAHWAQAVAAGIASAALLVWLLLYTRFSAPINKQLADAAEAGRTPTNSRALQAKWDSIIDARAALQGIAVAAACVALAV
ncbi:DUF1772 domain-containing protein [Mycolicibacterium sp. 018/SC-01/001]|uniref:DUF1772 domain-containing protein n=1 Tax=Mycolicibacterium sp. 018/SC-01/001 TaxID=2592069 RepID=UPI00117F9C77|nr:DUF1772 domain-containing protein [Mycolicibacterium sp. 018/SC-01/001]TRW82090.1 DUF1772 domain-containing protein [Mycolicibacterium sp. 018/SC-01/001]